MKRGLKFATWFHGQLLYREMSPADFARRTEIKPQTISKWLLGERVPSPLYCDLIADAFLLDPDIVLDVAGHRPMPKPVDPDDPKVEILGLVDRVDWSSERNVRLVRSLLGELIREAKVTK